MKAFYFYMYFTGTVTSEKGSEAATLSHSWHHHDERILNPELRFLGTS
jgi:hypothetical protein